MLFLAVFTKFNLWKYLNVWMPENNSNLINIISYTLSGIGIVSLSVGLAQSN